MKLNWRVISVIIFVAIFWVLFVLIISGCNDAQQTPQSPNQISSVNPASWIDVNNWGEWQNLQVLTVTKNLSPITAGCIALGIIGVILIFLNRVTIGVACLAGAIAGIGLVMGVNILATHEWSHWIIGGLMVALLAVGAVYLFLDLWAKIKATKELPVVKTALKEVVAGNEVFKNVAKTDLPTEATLEAFKTAQIGAQKTPTTKSIIDKIREAL